MRRWGVLLVVGAAACAPAAVDVPVTTTPRPAATSPSSGPTAAPPSSVAPESASTTAITIPPESLRVESYPVPAGSHPHDVAPALDGGVWYTAQNSGELGWLDPATGETRHIGLGSGSRPHGVIVDAAGNVWVTDGGLNAIVAVDPVTFQVTTHPLPADRAAANLNTATIDGEGVLWFTGQGGVYGSLDPADGQIAVFDAPGGRGPYGIATTPGGTVFYASLAGSYVGALDNQGAVSVLDPPTPDQGARRVWSDSMGAIWVSEWNSGNLSRYTPETGSWDTWHLPADGAAAAYAIFVDERDIVWASDFGSNAIVRFDPVTERFDVYALPHDPGEVRQLHGRPGEVWGAESAADHLVVIRTS
jgi:virginiamycin B lyase